MNSNHWKRSLKYFSALTFKIVNNKISSLLEGKEMFGVKQSALQEKTYGIFYGIFSGL